MKRNRVENVYQVVPVVARDGARVLRPAATRVGWPVDRPPLFVVSLPEE
jgi:hypothetical protein